MEETSTEKRGEALQNLNVQRLEWALDVYDCCRREHAPNAPHCVTFFIGFPSSKKVNGATRLHEVHFECFDPPHDIGADNVIILHPAAFAEPVIAVSQILLAAIRVSLDKDAKTKKSWQIAVQKAGFLKPWANPTMDDDAEAFVRGVLDQVGLPPEGAYHQPESEAKQQEKIDGAQEEKRQKKKKVNLFCACVMPEAIEVTVAQLKRGRLRLICGHCGQPYKPQEEIGITWADGGVEAQVMKSSDRDVDPSRYSGQTRDLFEGEPAAA